MRTPAAGSWALLNSRKPRAVSPADRWVRLTGALARHAARSGAAIVTGLGPLHYDLVLWHAVEAGGRAVVVLGGPGGSARDLDRRYPEAVASSAVTAVPDDPPAASPAERDRRVAALAELAVVIEARAGGIVERIAADRLNRGDALLVCPGDGTPGTAGNARLIRAGAQPLDLEALGGGAAADDVDAIRSALARSPRPGAARARLRFGPRAAASPVPRWNYVMHFTRACRGAYPGESRWEYLAALACGGAGGRRDGIPFRDALHALERILLERRIRAGSRLIRGAQPVVCMTDLHPVAVARLARWARHLVRWHFEPYAVGLRREPALRSGIRPAIYAPAAEFATIPQADRYRFQRHEPPRVDWSAEREWRAAGDVDLSRWSPGDALVLVPDEAAAAVVRPLTPFRVAAVSSLIVE